jgi:hypothetical protein
MPAPRPEPLSRRRHRQPAAAGRVFHAAKREARADQPDALDDATVVEGNRSETSLPGLRACPQLLVVIPASREEHPRIVDLLRDVETLGRLRRVH